MRARARIRHLEQQAGPPGCRERLERIVLTSATELPDETVVPSGDRPQPCPECGEVPDQVIGVAEAMPEGINYDPGDARPRSASAARVALIELARPACGRGGPRSA